LETPLENPLENPIEGTAQNQKTESTFQSMGLQPIVPSLDSAGLGVALLVLSIVVIASVIYRFVMNKNISKRQSRIQSLLSKEISKHKSSSLPLVKR
jgi:hypothetical protein